MNSAESQYLFRRSSLISQPLIPSNRYYIAPDNIIKGEELLKPSRMFAARNSVFQKRVEFTQKGIRLD